MGAGGRVVQIGGWRVTALRDGTFALDGGAMFGVVPRTIWEKLTPVNADHTVPLSTTPYLLEKGEWKVVIEPGIGVRWNDKQRAMFHIEHGDGRELLASLRAAGVAPEQVTHCLMTHCHWDHLGAVCGADGKPVFPNAAHWTPKIELQAALTPDHLRRASYRREDVQPLVDAEIVHTFTGAKEVLPGLRMVEVGGHSDGVSLVILQDGGATACFWADVVPTANHVHLPFIMAYDMNAEKSWQVRNEWIPRAAAEGWWNLLYHDVATPIGKFAFDGKKYSFAPLPA
jgi:glyoxylase-like metal-dependent hydrolase (beta-lactamase superfamily II)